MSNNVVRSGPDLSKVERTANRIQADKTGIVRPVDRNRKPYDAAEKAVRTTQHPKDTVGYDY